MTPRSIRSLVLACAPLAALLLPACVSLEQAAPPTATLGARGASPACAEGRRLYLTTCTKCHSPEPIRDHSLADWESDIMPTMSRKAKLAPPQSQAVMTYVRAVIETPPAPAPR